jgi:hypothetical protein
MEEDDLIDSELAAKSSELPLDVAHVRHLEIRIVQFAPMEFVLSMSYLLRGVVRDSRWYDTKKDHDVDLKGGVYLWDVTNVRVSLQLSGFFGLHHDRPRPNMMQFKHDKARGSPRDSIYVVIARTRPEVKDSFIVDSDEEDAPDAPAPGPYRETYLLFTSSRCVRVPVEFLRGLDLTLVPRRHLELWPSSPSGDALAGPAAVKRPREDAGEDVAEAFERLSVGWVTNLALVGPAKEDQTVAHLLHVLKVLRGDEPELAARQPLSEIEYTDFGRPYVLIGGARVFRPTVADALFEMLPFRTDGEPVVMQSAMMRSSEEGDGVRGDVERWYGKTGAQFDIESDVMRHIMAEMLNVGVEAAIVWITPTVGSSVMLRNQHAEMEGGDYFDTIVNSAVFARTIPDDFHLAMFVKWGRDFPDAVNNIRTTPAGLQPFWDWELHWQFVGLDNQAGNIKNDFKEIGKHGLPKIPLVQFQEDKIGGLKARFITTRPEAGKTRGE